jgi:hypothetical protein
MMRQTKGSSPGYPSARCSCSSTPVSCPQRPNILPLPALASSSSPPFVSQSTTTECHPAISLAPFLSLISISALLSLQTARPGTCSYPRSPDSRPPEATTARPAREKGDFVCPTSSCILLRSGRPWAAELIHVGHFGSDTFE